MAISHFTLVEHSLSKTEILGKKINGTGIWTSDLTTQFSYLGLRSLWAFGAFNSISKSAETK